MKAWTVVSLVVGCLFSLSIQAHGQGFVITTIAGGGLPPTPAPALSVGIDNPANVAVDRSGNLYFSSRNAVYRVDASGIITRVAGSPGQPGYSGDGDAATDARLTATAGLAFDAAGNLYIADLGSSCVRKVTSSGTISTFAGNGTWGFSGDGGQATNAALNGPWGLTVDSAGNVYIGDVYNNRVRKVTPTGIISTVAGNGESAYSGDGGPATSASLTTALGYRFGGNGSGLAVDTSGNLYIADNGSNVVRKVTPAGIIYTVVGNGTAGHSGDGGPATNAKLWVPAGITVDAVGNLYIADEGSFVRKVSPNGIISTIAGSGAWRYSGDGGDGGPAISADLNPVGVASDAAGNIYVADLNNSRIRRVTPAGIITTVAGIGTYAGAGDGGPATAAEFAFLGGHLAWDNVGNLYLADQNNNRIRKVTPAGIVYTVAGNGVGGFSGDGGSATSAQLKFPTGVAFYAAGNLYIADSGNTCIRKVTPEGIISTVVGNRQFGYSGDGGLATNAQLSSPEGLMFDASGNLYIADQGNARVRRVTPAGIISTVAGNGTSGFSGDGGPALSAQLSYSLSSLAFDTVGNLYIADTSNYRVRKVTPAGIISTVAGNGSSYGHSGDGGPATDAQLGYPAALAFDVSGNMYIADYEVVRKITPAGTISTVAGNGTTGDSGDGGPAIYAQFFALGLALDASGRIYVVDSQPIRSKSSVRLLVPQGTRPVLAMSMTHAANFTRGDTGQAYSILVTNAQTAGPTTGTVTVTETVPMGLSLISMTGSGWNCSGNSCTRSDTLVQSSSYPPITVTVNVDPAAPIQFDNEATLTGGGVIYPLYAFDTTTVNAAAQGCTYSLSPTNQSFPFAGGSGTITVTTQSNCAWSATNSLIWVSLTTSASGTGTGTVGFQVASGVDAARTGTITIAGQSFTVTQDGISGPCRYSINPTDQSFPASGGTGTITVTTQTGCLWSESNSLSWVTLTGSSSGTGAGSASFQVAANPGATRSGTFTVAGQNFTVEQDGNTAFTSTALFPHFASGGGWNTRLILINTGQASITARLNFLTDTGATIALPLNLLQTTGTATLLASTLERTLAVGATLVIDTASTDPTTQAGWVQVLSTGAVAGYDNFRLSTSNGFREVFLPLQSASANTLLLPFDHTDDYGTGIAVANSSTASSSVGVTIRDDSGNLILTTTVQVPIQGHKSFDLAADYPAAAGKRGTIEFDGPGSGGIGALGVRYGANHEIAAVVPVVK